MAARWGLTGWSKQRQQQQQWLLSCGSATSKLSKSFVYFRHSKVASRTWLLKYIIGCEWQSYRSRVEEQEKKFNQGRYLSATNNKLDFNGPWTVPNSTFVEAHNRLIRYSIDNYGYLLLFGGTGANFNQLESGKILTYFNTGHKIKPDWASTRRSSYDGWTVE